MPLEHGLQPTQGVVSLPRLDVTQTPRLTGIVPVSSGLPVTYHAIMSGTGMCPLRWLCGCRARAGAMPLFPPPQPLPASPRRTQQNGTHGT